MSISLFVIYKWKQKIIIQLNFYRLRHMRMTALLLLFAHETDIPT